MVEPGSLADHHGFPRRPRDTAKRSRGRARADIGIGIAPEFLHPGLVAKDRAARAAARRVHRQNRDLVAGAGQHLAERLNEGAFADTGHPGDADPPCLPGEGQKRLQHGMRLAPVRRIAAFDQGDRPRQDRAIPGTNAGDIIVGAHLAPLRRGTGLLRDHLCHADWIRAHAASTEWPRTSPILAIRSIAASLMTVPGGKIALAPAA